MSKMKAFSTITVLFSAIKLMMKELKGFCGILIITYLAFGATKFLLPGNITKGFISAIVSEFWASIAGEAQNGAGEQSWFVATLSPIAAILIILILMNVLTTMLTDLYTKEKEAAEASWCREQAVMIFDVIEASGDEDESQEDIRRNQKAREAIEKVKADKTEVRALSDRPRFVREKFQSAVKKIIAQLKATNAFKKQYYETVDNLHELADQLGARKDSVIES
jgi:hypothetical protein